jgi:hypothetical protein
MRLGIVWFSRQLTKLNSFIEQENNRYLMSKLQHCGKQVYFHGKVTIIAPANVKMFDNVHIGKILILVVILSFTLLAMILKALVYLLMMFINSNQ